MGYQKGHWGEYSGNAKWSKDHAHTKVTKENYKSSERDDAAHIDYLKRDVLYDDHHGHSDEKMTADEKHISKLAGDMKYDKEHHGSPAKNIGKPVGVSADGTKEPISERELKREYNEMAKRINKIKAAPKSNEPKKFTPSQLEQSQSDGAKVLGFQQSVISGIKGPSATDMMKEKAFQQIQNQRRHLNKAKINLTRKK